MQTSVDRFLTQSIAIDNYAMNLSTPTRGVHKTQLMPTDGLVRMTLCYAIRILTVFKNLACHICNLKNFSCIVSTSSFPQSRREVCIYRE